MIGKKLSHYEILDEINRGGMGIVYRAQDLKLNREVALKVLPPELVSEPDRRHRFVQEARATAALEHPHIGVIHEIDEDNDSIFIAMEHIRGSTLARVMDTTEMSLTRCLELAGQIANGLSHAHSKGIVHRDIKPSNIMLTEQGYPKLIDFGLAKLLDAEKNPFLGQTGEEETALRSETREGMIVGTVSYMSPEQARGGKVDHRSDIFSFGLLLYHLASGRAPYMGQSRLDTLHGILHEPTPSLPELSATPEIVGALQAVIDRCMEKEPAKRYQSMEEIEKDLRRVRVSVESSETSHLPLEISKPDGHFWRYLLASIVIVGVVATLLNRSASLPSGAAGEDASKPSLAVMHFDNLSGEEELEWLRVGLTDMLVTDLSQSPHIELIGTDRLQQVLEDLGRADDRQLPTEAIGQVAYHTGADTILVGSFAKAGATIRLSARLQDADTGRVLASEKVEGDGEESIFRLVDDLSRRIQTHLRDSSDESPDTPGLDRDLKDVTTASLEAYKHYAEGIRLHELYREEEAVSHFENALEVDPGFAMALAKLGVVHSNLGREKLANEYAQRALANLERASARERYYIEGWAYSLAAETTPEAIEAYRNAVDLYPDHASARHNLANLLLKQESYSEAVEHLEELRRLGTAYPQTWEQLANAHAMLGHYDEAEEVLSEFIERTPDSWSIRTSLARLQTLTGRDGETERLLEEATQLGAPEAEVAQVRFLGHLLEERWDEAGEIVERHLEGGTEREQFLWGRNASLVDLYQGHSRSVLAGLEQYLSSLGEDLEYASGPMTFLAMLHIDRGDYQNARDVGERLKRLGSYGRINGTFIQILADEHLGESENADRALEAYRQVLDQAFGRGAERIHFMLDGKLKIHRREYEAAIQSLTEAESLLPPQGPEALHSTIWFALAQAHREAGNEAEAIRWYRRITESRLERLFDPVSYVRSFYFLGKIYEDEGEAEQARDAYERFVDYWEDGDLDRERVREAEARIEALE